MTTRFADPTRCPDCGGGISYQTPTCPTCGLPLRGAVAHRLFETLSLADRLLVELRASSLIPSAARAPGAAPVAPAATVRRPAPGPGGGAGPGPGGDDGNSGPGDDEEGKKGKDKDKDKGKDKGKGLEQ